MIGTTKVIGVALSDTTLYAPGCGTWELGALDQSEASYEAWRDALQNALHDALRRIAPHGRVAVALLPSIAPIRSVKLPKLRTADLEAVLARTITRYFPAIREPHQIAAVRIAPEEGEYRYTIVAVRSALLDTIQRAVDNAGWTLDRLVPAYAAWAVAAQRKSAHPRRTEMMVAIQREDGGDDVLRVTRGLPASLRRLRSDVQSTVRGGAPEGDSHAAAALKTATRLDTPIEVAARFAPHTRVLELMTEDGQARARQLQRTRWQTVAIAAGIALVASFGGLWWRTGKTLHAIEAERAALHPQVAEAARVRAAWLAALAPAQTLTRLEEHSARWSVIVSDLSSQLPASAYIQGIRASNDSLFIDGAAESGTVALRAVAGSPLLTGVAPVGPLRREAPANDSAATGVSPERFTLAARVANVTRLLPAPSKRRSAR